MPLSSSTSAGCSATIRLSRSCAFRSPASGTRCWCILPAASRRSAPCCPAAQKFLPKSRSISATERPLMSATAPPVASRVVASRCPRSSSIRTSCGLSAMSRSVPSMSRKNPESAGRRGTVPSGKPMSATAPSWRGCLRVPTGATSRLRLLEFGIGTRGSGAAQRNGLAPAVRAGEQARAHAHLARVEQHAPGPAVHVEFLDEAAHAAHPVALLRGRHRERRLQGSRALIDVVGIDDQGFGQLPRRPRELAENEHPALVVARGHELLGDEVHAVVQAAYETQLGGPVVLVDVVWVVMLDLEQDRLVVLVREFVVDPARERAYARVVVLVLVDAGARRRRDLHEDELADPFGFELEKAFDREESFEYSLGIVEAVHADADHRVRGEAVSLAHVGAAIPQRLLHGLGVERPFYRYRIAAHRGLVSA